MPITNPNKPAPQLINRWLVQPDTAEAKALDLEPTARHFNGPNAEANARAVQEQFALQGCSAQLYHERHVLIREPVQWTPGNLAKRPRAAQEIGQEHLDFDVLSGKSSLDSTMGDMIKGMVQIAATAALAHGATVSPEMLRGELPPRKPADG